MIIEFNDAWVKIRYRNGLSKRHLATMTSLKSVSQDVPRVTSDTLLENPHAYLKAATAPNTRKAYQSDVQHFMSAGGLLPTSTEGILNYLHKFANQLNARTLQRRLTALKQWHLTQGFSDPTAHPLVHKTVTGIYHVHGKPAVKAPALSLDHLTQLAHYLQASDKLTHRRDNALLQIGFFGAFRRSELVAIQWQQVSFVCEGVEILIPRSKTDQAGNGVTCAIPYGHATLCPVVALKIWHGKSGSPADGFVFSPISKSGTLSRKPLSTNSVNILLKQHATACQLPQASAYSGHSLRRGFATGAAQKGATLGAIMRQGRWRQASTVHGYVEEGQRFEANAAGLLLSTQSTEFKSD